VPPDPNHAQSRRKQPNPSNIVASSIAQPIPEGLSHLIALKAEDSVLICIGNACRHALKPTAISRHLDIKPYSIAEARRLLH